MERDVASATWPADRLRLAGLTLDLKHGELRAASGELAELRRQALDVLLTLGAHAGHVVSKEELIRRVWPNVVVSEDSLVQAIADIRRALGEDGHRLVRTIPRRGYLLVAEPADPGDRPPSPGEGGATATNVATAPPATPRLSGARRHRRWIPLAASLILAAAVAVAMIVIETRPRDEASSLPALNGVPARSLVVLPFESEGASDQEAWFADAVTVDLTRTLGRWPNVLVIDQGSARKYKGKRVDPREAARELGVRYVIRGAVSRDGERVQLDLTLVDGESGAQRWSERMVVERSRLAQSSRI